MIKKTQEQKEVDAEMAFKINEKIKERETGRRKDFILNVLDLVKMHDENLFPAILGEGVEPKWAGYLSQIEVFYTRSQVERWRKIIAKLVGEFKFEPDRLVEVPETRLENIADIAKTNEEAMELFEQAKVMMSLDWKNTVREKQGKITTENCGHKSFKIYRICEQCGLKIKENIDVPENKKV